MELLEIMKSEKEALNYLKELLNEQYQYIMKNDVFKLDEIVERIQQCNKKIAECEVNRRRVLAGKPLKDVVQTDEDLMQEYIKVKDAIREITLQKETNELLIKQQLILTNRLLALINPNREQKTYNSYGNLKK